MTATCDAPRIWRGLRAKLPADVHAAVHDETRPKAERAKALADWLALNPLGWHWSSVRKGAERWATGAILWARIAMPPGPDVTEIMLTAVHPGERAVLPLDTAARIDDTIGLAPSDHEVPLREGWPLEVEIIQWRLSGTSGGYGCKLRPRKWEA